MCWYELGVKFLAHSSFACYFCSQMFKQWQTKTKLKICEVQSTNQSVMQHQLYFYLRPVMLFVCVCMCATTYRILKALKKKRCKILETCLIHLGLYSWKIIHFRTSASFSILYFYLFIHFKKFVWLQSRLFIFLQHFYTKHSGFAFSHSSLKLPWALPEISLGFL